MVLALRFDSSAFGAAAIGVSWVECSLKYEAVDDIQKHFLALSVLRLANGGSSQELRAGMAC